jgi:2-polyprenyl-3-methyl-5-hydroxy-6-metoxy-1,4-benzoquinol methylase
MLESPKRLALADINTTLLKGEPVVDVGFGDGSFLQALSEHHYFPIGIECSDKAIQAARKVLPPHVTLLHSSVPIQILDTIQAKVYCCFEVIEHLESPTDFLRDMPGKVLYLSTPNPHRWLPTLTGKYEKWDYPPNHLYRFERDILERMLSEAGYNHIAIQKTPVEAHTLLRALPLRSNGENYDDIRPRFNPWTTVARLAALPATWPLARLMTLCGLQGVSWYVKAERV